MEEIFNLAEKQRLIDQNHFEDLFTTDIRPLTKLFRMPANSFIIKSTSQPQYLFYLIKGRAKLYDVTANGKTMLIDFFTPPCFIGEMELIDPTGDPFSVQAIGDCLCLALPIHRIQKQLLVDPIFLKHICLYLAHKNTRNIRVASKNQTSTLSERLAAFILMTEHNGVYKEKHTEVSEFLGVSYRHLLYVLREFMDAGLLSKQGHRSYLIQDRQELERIAEGNQS
ncbi:transcriptional regulator YeiL [Secundilactobacillus folii]|uniref:Transcriptional regulator YeiL n=1 Tax=Secundilactobacillus folii TaxID=2678357 RepID=A0A7X3C395_9LACO|nr:transcriptional regulator YeiL [Secundilactobacillus folii]MTV82662.1 transcriptional regulator YeiL [Secundilactobacillus folii]